jgi:hypothetical protein
LKSKRTEKQETSEMAESEFTNSDGNGTGTKEQVQEAAQTAASKTQDVVRNQVDQRSTQAGEEVSSVAESLRAVSEQLQEKDGARGAQLTGQAADRAEKIGEYLRESDADRLLRDAEDFGRRQPWLVLGGGVLLGIAAARFLKASSRDRYESGRSSGASSPGTNGSGSMADPGTLSDPLADPVPEPQMPSQPVQAGAGIGTRSGGSL